MDDTGIHMPLIVEIRPGEKKPFIVRRTFRYKIAEKDEVWVVNGFETDFASVPWFLKPWINVAGRHAKAALVHDALYEWRNKSRRQIDRVFLDSMRECETSFLKRWTMYIGVRIGGWWPWYRKVAHDAEGDVIGSGQIRTIPAQMRAMRKDHFKNVI